MTSKTALGGIYPNGLSQDHEMQLNEYCIKVRKTGPESKRFGQGLMQDHQLIGGLLVKISY